MEDKSPYIVGICGPSGAGKTFLLQQIAQRFLPEQISIISQDLYYRDDAELVKDSDGMINYDHPDAMDLERLVGDIQHLIKGHIIEVEQYFYTPSSALPSKIQFIPAPLILVEGIFTLYHPPLYDLLSLKIFVEAPEQVRLERRIRRDQEERGYSRSEILKTYEKYVAPMYKQFVEPYKGKSDLIIPNHSDISKAVEVITQHLENAVQKNC